MKRFWTAVTSTPADGGWQVMLDGRGMKTAAGAQQIVPTAALAEALAHEWTEQGETVDPTRFRHRPRVDHAIDVIALDPNPTDRRRCSPTPRPTRCATAQSPTMRLWRRQREIWDPLADAVARREGVTFEAVSGILHRPQPLATLARLRERLSAFDPFALAAMQDMASLATSLIVALAATEPDADVEAVWDAANLEEDWQAERWGRDAEAEARRDERRAAFMTAHELWRLSQSADPSSRT